MYSVFVLNTNIKKTRNSSVGLDDIGERTLRANLNYRLKHAMVVKLHHPYTQFPRNVRLSRRQIATS